MKKSITSLLMALLCLCVAHTAGAKNYNMVYAELYEMIHNGTAKVTSNSGSGFSYSIDQAAPLIIKADNLTDFTFSIPGDFRNVAMVVIHTNMTRKDTGRNVVTSYGNVTLNAVTQAGGAVFMIEMREGPNYFTTEGDEECGEKDPAKPFQTKDAPYGLRFVFKNMVNIKECSISQIEVVTEPEPAKFAIDKVSVSAGDSFKCPDVIAEGADVEQLIPTSFKVDNADVVMYNAGTQMFLALKAGTAKVTATIPAYPASDSYGSYDMPESTAVFTVTVTPFAVTGSVEDITLTEPNTLRQKLMELESLEIGSLTLHGPVGSEDLKLINEHNGRLSNLQNLDLADVTLVPDEGLFASRSVRSDVGIGNLTDEFYLSEREEREHSGSFNGVTGNATDKIYTMRLGALVHGNSELRRLVMPRSTKVLGEYLAEGASSLYEVVLPAGIDSIPDYAFSGCRKLTTINMGPVKKVGEYAFNNTSLAQADLSEATAIGKYAFAGCMMSKVDISSLSNVEEGVFANCASLKDVIWSKQLKSIGVHAFFGTALTDLILPEGLLAIDLEAFRKSSVGEITLPSTALRVHSLAFSETPWEYAQRRQITEGIIYLGNVAMFSASNWPSAAGTAIKFREGTMAIADAFSLGKPENVTKLELPASLRRIGSGRMFEYVTEVNLPQGLESIGENAFYSAKMKKVTIPASVNEIGDDAFANNTNLIMVEYNAANAVGGDRIFSNCTALESVTIGAGVPEVPESAFRGCTNLYQIKYLGEKASKKPSVATRATGNTGFIFRERCFYQCTALKVVEYPAATRSIEDYAFCYSGLTEAKLPWHITELGSAAFYNCKSLTTVYLPYSLKTIPANAFTGDPVASIYAYGSDPVEVTGDERDFVKLAQTAKVYVRPDCLYTWDGSPVWTKFDIYEMDQEHIDMSGVGTIVIDSDNADATMYDLQGSKVSHPVKGGIYILRSNGDTRKIRF